jgi:hypothetical protein
MIKLRMAAGLGLLLLMAAMACGQVRNQAPANGGGVTLASLAGKFETRGSGSYTVCLNASFSAPVDCASASHQEMPFNLTSVAHVTRDAGGNSCAVTTLTNEPAYGTISPAFRARINNTRTNVSTTTSFDPATGSGSSSFSQYRGGRCIGAVFDSTGAVLTGTGTQSLETIITSFSVVTNPFGVGNLVAIDSQAELCNNRCMFRPAVRIAAIRRPVVAWLIVAGEVQGEPRGEMGGTWADSAL